MSHASILVAVEENDFQQELFFELSQSGFRVRAPSKKGAALSCLSQEFFDVALLGRQAESEIGRRVQELRIPTLIVNERAGQGDSHAIAKKIVEEVTVLSTIVTKKGAS